jgi:hypothetical protein
MTRRSRASRPTLPEWIRPQLTQLVEAAPDGDQWLHEIKYDGYRMMARLDHGAVKLLTRTGLLYFVDAADPEAGVRKVLEIDRGSKLSRKRVAQIWSPLSLAARSDELNRHSREAGVLRAGPPVA